MSIILSDVSYRYGDTPLFGHVTLNVNAGERVALLGRNGSGKSTLLRLMEGSLTPTTGHVTRTGKLAYLQQLAALPEVAVIDAVQPIGLEQARRALSTAEARLGAPTPAHLEQYARAEEAYRLLGGYDAEHRAQIMLSELQLDPWQPTQSLSGGQRRRALLAQLLLTPADLYLLDEPTNHLDWPSLEWLEAGVKASPAAFLIVSHDRAFLDSTVTRCAELEGQTLREYPGNHTQAMDTKATLQAARARQYQAHERKVQALTQEMVSVRQRAASTDRYNPRRKKRGNKRFAKNNAQNVAQTLARRAQALERRVDRMQAPEQLRSDCQLLHLHLSSADHCAAEILTCQGVDITVGEVSVLKNVHLHVRRGEKIAVVGPNGAGKSTLLNALLGLLPLSAGTIYRGPVGVQRAGQHNDELDAFATQQDALLAADPTLSTHQLFGILRRLGLPQRPDHAVRALSGGQRTRLALARLSVTKAGLLVLDEPTNHLDVPAIEALEDVLHAYDGTVIFASHDRHLVAQVATRCWWVEDGHVVDLGETLRD